MLILNYELRIYDAKDDGGFRVRSAEETTANDARRKNAAERIARLIEELNATGDVRAYLTEV